MATQLTALDKFEVDSEFRARWKTEAGRAIVAALVSALRAKSSDWTSALTQMPKAKNRVAALDDLRGLELESIDLCEVDLSHCDLSYAAFLDCNLRAVCLQGSIIRFADFRRSSMGGADLLQVEGQHATFEDADLSGAMMMSGSFREASFRRAVMRATILDRSDLSYADLSEADLRHAELQLTTIEGIVVSSQTQGPEKVLALSRQGAKAVSAEVAGTSSGSIVQKAASRTSTELAKTQGKDFALSLHEKQTVKRRYGVLEKQFRRYFAEAESRSGNTGKNLLLLLESRLDNVVFRMGFGSTRADARRLVSSKSVLVNGHVVNLPSYLVKAGDVVTMGRRVRRQVGNLEGFAAEEKAETAKQLRKWLKIAKSEEAT
jgi:ribosomal protein S4